MFNSRLRFCPIYMDGCRLYAFGHLVAIMDWDTRTLTSSAVCPDGWRAVQHVAASFNLEIKFN